MKNLIFTLAFMLVGSFAFASNESKSIETSIESIALEIGMNKSEIHTVVKEIIFIDSRCYVLHVVYRKDGSEMGSFTLEVPCDHEDAGGFVGHQVSW